MWEVLVNGKRKTQLAEYEIAYLTAQRFAAKFENNVVLRKEVRSK